MSKEENSKIEWSCFGISLGFFGILLVFYVLYLYYLSINSWQEAILFFSSLLILIVVLYYYVVIITFSHSIPQFLNKIDSQCCILAVYETIALLLILFISIDNLVILGFLGLILTFLALFASTKFFYTEPECWWKRMWANIEEWLLNDNFFWKALLWSVTFLLLFTFVLVTVIILYYKHNSGYEFLVNLITNRDLFEWTLNLFLFTFFALIISVLGQLFDKDKVGENPVTDGRKNSEFLFYMLSVKALIIGALVLIVAYVLTRTFILNIIQYSSNLYIYKNHLLPCCIDKHIACVNSVGNSNMLFWISIYYAIFITIYYYFVKKFFEVINFAMPAHRLQMKIKVLSCSPLNKNTLRLWNAFWGNEQFDNFWEEAAFLNSFIRKIVHRKIKITSRALFKNYKDIFQLKDRVSVAADVLRNFSDNIDKRYSEALAREVLNIVPRRDAHPDMLLDYLVDALNAYKDIVCNDKLVCEEPDFEISFYKGFFKSEANEFLPKYQYLDELIYQILVTLRKSIEKLRNDKYFEKYDESRKTLCEKFNNFANALSGLQCKNDGKEKFEETLKTESAKKWIKEVGNLLEKVVDNNKDININNNRATLTFNFTKAVQELKNGNIDTDVLKKVLEKWTEICKQDSTKQDNPKQS